MGQEGYDKLAVLLARYPDLMIYRKFGRLGTKCLLYMQAELSHLEYDLDVIRAEDRKYTQTAGFDYSWEKMDKASSDDAADAQSQKVREILTKLETYR
jgi:hypothetical protein